MAASGSTVLQEQDTKTYLIMLKKGGKDICRVQCSLHIELPLSWNITRFVSKITLENLADCNHLRIYQAPQTNHEEQEWGAFLRFLRNNAKVAVVGSEPYCFYILPPDGRTTLEWAQVAFVVEEVFDNCGNQKDALSASGDTMAQNMSVAPPKVSTNTVLDVESQCTRKDHALNPNLVTSVHPSILKFLGRAHDWIFGAVADLVDNSRDANASRLEIFIQNLHCNKAGADIPVLSFVDDGCGMTYEEIREMVSLGRKKQDKDDFHRIGRSNETREGCFGSHTNCSNQIYCLPLQSLNEGKDMLEIPIISYKRRGQAMLLDTSVQSESLAKHNMKTIKEFSPFDKFLIGHQLANFERGGTGTQIFVWNLERLGSSYALEWKERELDMSFFHLGDIVTRHGQVRTCHGQVSQKVPLNYSLQAYLEVIFLDPRMKIYVQSSKVKSRSVAKFLSKRVVENGTIMGKHVQLILGRCQLEWEQANCGIFLYWHGRLIEAYKKVGVMMHGTDMGRGVIGVIDVSPLMDGDNGPAFLRSDKQGFLDREHYILLVEWLSSRVNAYCDRHADPLHVEKDDALPDKDWIQCDKCRKWRTLPSGFDRNTLPPECLCCMIPDKGTCSNIPEAEQQSGAVIVSTKQYGYDCDQNSGCENNDGRSSYSHKMIDYEEEEVELQKPLKRRRGC